MSSDIAGYTKKQLTGAALFMEYCVGGIIGTQTVRDREKGGCRSADVARLIG
tara:strand:+ start:26305 stop:26460 length:156 start_codon:yes stop_codon:yes gene_type:complete